MKATQVLPINYDDNISKCSEPPSKSSKGVRKLVEVSFKIYSIADIDCIEVTFRVNIKLFLRWEDPQLIGIPEGTILNHSQQEQIHGIFDPDIRISNEFELEQTSREFRVIDSTLGRVKLSLGYRGKIYIVDMSLKYFPFDAQNLQIILRPHKLDENKLILEYCAEESASDYHPVHEWRFVGFCAKRGRTDPNTSSAGKIYSTLHILICVQRESDWFVNNIIMPTFVLTMVSWATFGLYPTADYGVRLDCTIGVILATIANKFVVGDSLPKVPFRTLVDQYIDVSFFCQVISIFATIFVAKYSEENAITSHWLNISFFLAELIIYVTFHIWFFWVHWAHRDDVKKWEEAVVPGGSKYQLAKSAPRNHLPMDRLAEISFFDHHLYNKET